jgi:hypothetical protein
MKSMKTISILAAILIAGCAVSAEAQTKPQKTSSAKAYYGTPSGKPKVNVNKKKKMHKRTPVTRGAKSIRANNKKRYSHS